MSDLICNNCFNNLPLGNECYCPYCGTKVQKDRLYNMLSNKKRKVYQNEYCRVITDICCGYFLHGGRVGDPKEIPLIDNGIIYREDYYGPYYSPEYVDDKGNTLFSMDGKDVRIRPFINNLAVFLNKDGKAQCINRDFKTQFISQKSYSYVGSFYDGLARVMQESWSDEKGHSSKEQWGFINTCGDEVIPCKFDKAIDFSQGRAIVSINKQTFAIDTSGKFIMQMPWLEHKLSDELYCTNDPLTLWDIFGHKLHNIESQYLPTYLGERFIIVYDKNGIGSLYQYNKYTNNLKEIPYKDKLHLKYGIADARKFQNGFARLEFHEEILRPAGAYLMPNGELLEIKISDNYSTYGTDPTKVGLSDLLGYDKRMLYPFNEDGTTYVNGGILRIVKFGFGLNRSIYAVEKPLYNGSGNISEGLIPFYWPIHNKSGYLNENGDIVIEYNDIDTRKGEFHGGIAPVQKKDNKKYGFIDKAGTAIIPFIYKHVYYCYISKCFYGYINGYEDHVIIPIKKR